MGHHILIAVKGRERAALLRLAGEMIKTEQQRNRPQSPGEDAMILELVKKAQALEHEITFLQKDRRRSIPSKHGKADDT